MRVCVKAYLLPPEKAHLDNVASRTRLSGSEVIRRLVRGAALPNVGDYDAIQDLLQVNGDLARLGNLLKLAIDESTVTHSQVLNLLNEIRIRQGEVKMLVADIAHSHKNRKRK